MKKAFLVSMLVMLLGMVSCHQENIEPVVEGSKVAFNVEIPGEIGTKTVADGENIDILYYAIYKHGEGSESHENGVLNPSSKPLASGYVEKSGSKTFNVTFDLLSDQDYVAIFWAQVGVEKKYYVWNGGQDYDDLRLISYADQAGVKGNMEERAAFFRTYKFSTYEPQDHNIKLYRPFAQLNLGTTLASLQPHQGGAVNVEHVIDVQTSQVKVTGLATSFNTISGLDVDDFCGKAEVAYDGEYIFKMHEVISAGTIADPNRECEYLEVMDKNGNPVKYEYVAMNYLFATDDCNVTVEYDIVSDKGTVNNTIKNVPVKENYRTNIIGNLLTSKMDFVITVDEDFWIPDEEIHYDENDFIAKNGYEFKNNCFEVYAVKGLAKWAYHVQNIDNNVDMILMEDIELPAFKIVQNTEKQTYEYSDEPIEVAAGVPTGSNWVPLGDATTMFAGTIDGNGKTIRGLRLTSDAQLLGFVAAALGEGTSIMNLNFEDACISGTDYVGTVAGYIRDGVVMKNCHVSNVVVNGREDVGAIVGRNYTRYSETPGLDGAKLPKSIVENCTTDASSSVKGVGNVGGIAGLNYGALILNCSNAATVEGNTSVGGIAGYSRDYHYYKSGWVIACVNEGEVSGTSNVASIIGRFLKDNNHTGSVNVMVACCSIAETGAYKNLLVGTTVNSFAYGSWGLKTKASQTPLSAGTYTACYAFDSAAAITQADVDAMNDSIDTYNAGKTAADVDYCPYKWAWTDGTLPVLQLQ